MFLINKEKEMYEIYENEKAIKIIRIYKK